MKLYLFFFLYALVIPSNLLLAQEAVERTREKEEPVSIEPSAELTAPAEPEVSIERDKTKTEARKKVRAAKPDQAATSLQDSMTATEFKAAGLEKLSAEELKNLNDWLQGYRRSAETKATEKATAEATKKAKAQAGARVDRADSRVDGTLERLTGHSVIKLEDGTTWKQANPEDRYRAQVTDHPQATVSHGAFGWKMRISGLPEVYVDPVR